MTAAARVNWLEQVKAFPVSDVAGRMGLEVLVRAADISFPCPACGKTQRHSKGSDPRKAAKVMPNGRWWCEPCGAGGDVVALAAAVVTGTTSPAKERWGDVRDACVRVGLCIGHAPHGRNVVAYLPPAPLLPATVADYAPTAEVDALWAASNKLSTNSEAGMYLRNRGFNLERLAWTQMVREAPPVHPVPLAWWPGAWLRRWPLMFPAYNARGAMVSLHARATQRDIEPKTRWPYRCNASGLLFADALGVTFLRECAQVQSVAGLEAVVVAEGATDTLKLAQVVEAENSTLAVLGYVSGSKHAFARIHWPADIPCLVATDDDEVGDKYAAEIRKALDWRVRVYRLRTPHGRASNGQKRGDWSDMPDADVLDAVSTDSRWEVCHG